MAALPTAYIFSNPNILSIFLVKELLSKSCRVIVVTNDRNGFRKYFPTETNLVIADVKEKYSIVPSYLFFIQGFAKDDFFKSGQIKKIFDFVSSYAPKTQVVLPYIVNEKERKIVEQIAGLARNVTTRNLNIVYLGDIYGGVHISNNGFVNESFRKISAGIAVDIPIYDLDLYVLEVRQAVKRLIREIFSYGFDKKEVVLTSKTKAFWFFRKIQESLPNIIFVPNKNIYQSATISNFDFVEEPVNDDLLKEDVLWFSKNKRIVEISKPKINFNLKVNVKAKPRLPNNTIKYAMFFAILVVWIFAIPFALLFVSSLILRTGYYDLSINDLKTAGAYFDTSQKMVMASQEGFKLFARIPIFGGIFNDGLKTTVVVGDFNKIGEKGIHTLGLLQTLGMEITSKGDYDLPALSNQIYLDLDDLYKQISFLQADIDGVNSLKSFLPDYSGLNTLKKYIDNGRTFALGIPQLLGQDKKMSYLLLLQDSRELRPTGGLISSYGIFTFEKGKIIDNTIFDVATADNQLRGYVAPPTPIRKYLGQTNWLLKDSNWDADFRVNAPKAEWFLETETGQNVDGVFAINLDLFNSLNNFKGNSFDWGKLILDGLQSKDIMAFLNDNSFADAFSKLNFDGGVVPGSIGLVEANLGANKVNPDVFRNVNITLNSNGGIVNGNIEVDFSNSSKTLPYRTYLRLLAPSTANFNQVIEKINGSTQTLNPDVNYTEGRSEAGVLVQIPPLGQAQVIYSLTGGGKIQLYIRKQPGMTSMPTSIVINNSTRYNTNLNEDFSL